MAAVRRPMEDCYGALRVTTDVVHSTQDQFAHCQTAHLSAPPPYTKKINNFHDGYEVTPGTV